ncbi:transposase, partial [Salmonella enterica subsp. enterica serovar Schwarzengrund]
MANRNRFSHCLFSAAALNAELTHHLRHEKNQPKSGTNSRNGYSTKTVTITDGPMELRTPRDRDGSFEP